MIKTCLSASLLYFCCCAISDVGIDVSQKKGRNELTEAILLS
jgi:hypothetical protein